MNGLALNRNLNGLGITIPDFSALTTAAPKPTFWQNLTKTVNTVSNVVKPVASTAQSVISTVQTAKAGGSVTVPGTSLTYNPIPQPQPTTGFKLSTPVKIGIGVAVVTVAGTVIYFATRKKKKKTV